MLKFASWAIRSADISINPCITLEMSLARKEPIIPDYLNYASTKAFTTKLDGQTTGTIPGAEPIELPIIQDSTAEPLALVVASELADSSDDKCASSGKASDDSTYYGGFACQMDEDTTEECRLSKRSRRWLFDQCVSEATERLPTTLLDCDVGIFHEMSKHLDKKTWGYDQWIETICTHTYNCYWNTSHHPFNKNAASTPLLPFRISKPRILGSFVNALQSYKAFDLTFHPDGPSVYHVIIPAMIQNKRTVTRSNQGRA